MGLGFLLAAGPKLTLLCRRIGASREQARRETDADERANGFGTVQTYDDDDMDL